MTANDKIVVNDENEGLWTNILWSYLWYVSIYGDGILKPTNNLFRITCLRADIRSERNKGLSLSLISDWNLCIARNPSDHIYLYVMI